MDAYDVESIEKIKSILSRLSVTKVLNAISSNAHDSITKYVDIRHCAVDHYGILVFPEAASEVVSGLESIGLKVAEPVPSVVVKSRLCERYRLRPDDIDVRIVRGAFVTDRFGRREIEVFAAMGPRVKDMADREREAMNEAHVAIMVGQPEHALEKMRRKLLESGMVTADGAGYNPLEKPHKGGRSVLYFRSREVRADRSFPYRLELTCAGEYADVIADHVRDGEVK